MLPVVGFGPHCDVVFCVRSEIRHFMRKVVVFKLVFRSTTGAGADELELVDFAFRRLPSDGDFVGENLRRFDVLKFDFSEDSMMT